MVVSLNSRLESNKEELSERLRAAALEATQGQMDGFFSQLPYLFEVASVGD